MSRKQKAIDGLVFTLFYVIGMGVTALTILGVYAVVRQVF